MEKRYLLPLLIAISVLTLTPFFTSGQIYINEFMASNASTITDPDFGGTGDWLELYNAGSADKNIGGYYLTDNLTQPQKWMIPSGTVIAAHSYLVFWADDYNTGMHLSFKLSADGESVGFVAPDGTILDEITFGEQITDVSYGRSTDGGSEWILMKNPTPGAANDPESFEGITQQPVVDVKGGFYAQPVTVSITPAQAGDVIRYTLDGSMPVAGSPLYFTPIAINKTTPLRVRSFRTGYMGSYTVNQTYFIQGAEHDLPVISVTADSVLLYDEEDGLFVHYETDSGWVDKEIPAGIEYYEKGGTQAFSVNAGISLQGGNTRTKAQKSLEVQFRNRYGTRFIEYQFFKNNKRNIFDSFNLRNAGNDWTNRGNNLGTMYCDGLQHSILENVMDLETSSYQPVVIYLNGEYYGLTNVRERQNEEYLSYYFGVDADNIDMFRLARGKFIGYDTVEVQSGDLQHFENLSNYLQTHDMSLNESYEHVKTQVDIKSLVNYYIAEIYYANIDWPNNNQVLWRPKEEGGKWRWILCDMDFGFNNFKWTTWPTWEAWRKDMFPLALGEEKYELYSYIVFRKLNDNQKFIDEFVQTFCHHLNTTFDTTRLTHFVDSLKGNIANEMHAHIDLWSRHRGTTDYETWEENILKYYDFADLHTPYMYEIIQDHYALNDTSLLVLENQKEKGTLYIYGAQIKPEHYSGYFYKDRTIEFSATPNPGYSFKGWRVYQSDNSYTLLEANPMEFTPSDYNRIEAEYEGYREIVINEVSALNESDITDEYGEYEDWIELHNPNDFAVNVGGYYLTDDFDDVDKWQILFTDQEKTTIPAKGYLVFWADDQTVQGILHTNFKLSSTGEGVGLSRTFGPAVHFIDTLTFPPLEAGISYGRSTDGAATFTTFETPTPGTANNPNGNGIADTRLTNFDVSVYPNPVRDELHIELQYPGYHVSSLVTKLFDISGRLVYQTETRNPQSSDRINVSTAHLDEGIYLLRIQADNRSKTVKIIKASTQ